MNNKSKNEKTEILEKTTSQKRKTRTKAIKTELVNGEKKAKSSKLKETLKMIDNISHTLGINQRIFCHMKQISDNELSLQLLNSKINLNSPWFSIQDEEPYIFMSAEILDMVFKMLKNLQKENFELRLERSILQHMPLDFGDVWRVAMDELSNDNLKKEPDLDKLLDKSKREHPNLFLNMENLLSNE